MSTPGFGKPSARGFINPHCAARDYPRLQTRAVEELSTGKGFQYLERQAATWKQAARGVLSNK